VDQQGQEVDANAVIGRLQGRVGQDAVTIAVLQAQVEIRDIEITRLRAAVADATSVDPPAVT